MQFNFSQRDLGFKEVILVYKKKCIIRPKNVKTRYDKPWFFIKDHKHRTRITEILFKQEVHGPQHSPASPLLDLAQLGCDVTKLESI